MRNRKPRQAGSELVRKLSVTTSADDTALPDLLPERVGLTQGQMVMDEPHETPPPSPEPQSEAHSPTEDWRRICDVTIGESAAEMQKRGLDDYASLLLHAMRYEQSLGLHADKPSYDDL